MNYDPYDPTLDEAAAADFVYDEPTAAEPEHMEALPNADAAPAEQIDAHHQEHTPPPGNQPRFGEWVTTSNGTIWERDLDGNDTGRRM